jgi:hypothetical protein
MILPLKNVVDKILYEEPKLSTVDIEVQNKNSSNFQLASFLL